MTPHLGLQTRPRNVPCTPVPRRGRPRRESRKQNFFPQMQGTQPNFNIPNNQHPPDTIGPPKGHKAPPRQRNHWPTRVVTLRRGCPTNGKKTNRLSLPHKDIQQRRKPPGGVGGNSPKSLPGAKIATLGKRSRKTKRSPSSPCHGPLSSTPFPVPPRQKRKRKRKSSAWCVPARTPPPRLSHANTHPVTERQASRMEASVTPRSRYPSPRAFSPPPHPFAPSRLPTYLAETYS
ncbi:hypothetical protein VUR80DRAFT_9751 [Thermomyces stellatus]